MTKIYVLIAAIVILVGYLIMVQVNKSNILVSNSDNVSTSTDEDVSAGEVNEVPNEDVDSAADDSDTLDLSGQGLTSAPLYIFDRVSLRELNLSNNKLGGSLQAEVRHLQNLKVLNLSNNNFTGIPAEIGQLQNLEVLDVSNNNLTGLPNELGNLRNLKTLNLRGNNYSLSDLDKIKANLSATTDIQVD